ncbi:MAG: hypothetical protein ACRES8_04900 [Nevskiaceae bacterium]
MRTDHYRVIRILQLERSDRMAERMRLQLYSAGVRCTIRHATSREDFVEALRQFRPDVLIAGTGLPTLDVPAALDLVGLEAPYLPTVFTSRDQLPKLGEAVLGALARVREVRGRRIADASARHAQLGAERLRAERTGEVTPLSVLMAAGVDPGYLH